MEFETMNGTPVLTNRYRFNEETLKKSYKTLMQPFVIFQLVIACAVLVLAVYYTVRYRQYFSQSKQLILMIGLLFALSLFEIWRALSSVNNAVKRAMKRTEENLRVREYEVYLRFEAEEMVTGTSLGTEAGHLRYDNIKKLKRYPDLIVIRTLARRAFTMDPRCFENGTEADFWKLMNEKCPAAVPKDRR